MFDIKDHWPDIKRVELKLDDDGYIDKIDVYITPAKTVPYITLDHMRNKSEASFNFDQLLSEM